MVSGRLQEVFDRTAQTASRRKCDRTGGTVWGGGENISCKTSLLRWSMQGQISLQGKDMLNIIPKNGIKKKTLTFCGVEVTKLSSALQVC